MSDSPPAEPADHPQVEATLAVPRLGTATATWLVVWGGCLLLGSPSAGSLVESTRGQLWQGAMWGAVSVAGWILASPPARWPRRLLGVLAVAILCEWFHLNSGRPLLRYVVGLGGFVLLQVAAATLLGWPGWSYGRQPLEQAPRYRFGIAGVMAVTAGVAVVLASGRLYEPAERLFFGSQIATVGLVGVALCGQRTMTSRPGGSRWALAMLGSGAGTAFLLGGLHTVQVLQMPLAQLGGTGWSVVVRQAIYYALPLMSFVAVVCFTAVCGRLDHERERAWRLSHRRAEAVE
jgi:hypothetical protein